MRTTLKKIVKGDKNLTIWSYCKRNNKMERQPTEGNKVFANHIFDKKLSHLKYITNSYNSVAKNNPIEK